MEWSHLFRRIYGFFGLAGGLLGIAGWQDDARAWTEWAGMYPELAGMLVGAGGVMFATCLVSEVRGILKRRKDGSNKDAPISVSYTDAGAIIDHYISPATVGMRPAVHIIVRKDLLEQFGKTTGAKLSEYEYNGVLLRQWLKSNAARFLVDYRGEMQ